jgi:hypothetical protein
MLAKSPSGNMILFHKHRLYGVRFLSATYTHPHAKYTIVTHQSATFVPDLEHNWPPVEGTDANGTMIMSGGAINRKIVLRSLIAKLPGSTVPVGQN